MCLVDEQPRLVVGAEQVATEARKNAVLFISNE
jgi:hypothetical protein